MAARRPSLYARSSSTALRISRVARSLARTRVHAVAAHCAGTAVSPVIRVGMRADRPARPVDLDVVARVDQAFGGRPSARLRVFDHVCLRRPGK